MHNPAHPGELVKHDCLDALGLSVTEGAKVLGVTRQALSNLVNKHAGLSPEIAIRLEKTFGSSAQAWLKMQMQYELWVAQQKASEIKVERYQIV
ncbi:MAG: HigA family addiction module antitoxin [Verrucomicrobiota bacterium]